MEVSEQFKIGSMYPQRAMPLKVRKEVKQPGTATLESNHFQQVLDQKFLKFSQHAEMRLSQRGIRIQPEQLNKLEEAVQKAAGRGAEDTLLLMNNLAFIVNVKSSTVVTAMDQQTLKDHVFTQIDSAVVVQ